MLTTRVHCKEREVTWKHANDRLGHPGVGRVPGSAFGGAQNDNFYLSTRPNVNNSGEYFLARVHCGERGAIRKHASGYLERLGFGYGSDGQNYGGTQNANFYFSVNLRDYYTTPPQILSRGTNRVRTSLPKL